MRTTNTIPVTVNGVAREIAGGLSVADLLHELGLHPRMVVVEHNREILRREQLSEVLVESGAVLELVHFVGGG